jgi:hypothetical protein
VWAGPVWSLTTSAALIVDDFEGYSNTSPDRPFQTWLDGFGYSEDEFFPAGYGGNGTGSGIGHDIWSLSSPHYDGTIMETAIVKSGSQSMPFYYTNASSSALSEATRTFNDPQNWAQAGIKGLKLAFHGDPANTATTMYLKINGTQIDYTGGADDILKKPWHTWYVDLTSLVGVNLETVTELTLGFKGGQGVVYFDDIVLTPLDRQLVTPVEPSGADLVAHYAFDGDATDSTGTHSMTAEGAPSYVAGMEGQAIKLNGVGDFVSVETSMALPTYTAALWLRAEGGTGQRDILSLYDNAGGFGTLIEMTASGEIRYLHRFPLGNAGGNSVYSDPGYDDGAWVHMAAVKTATSMSLFVNGLLVDSVDDATQYETLQRITLGVLKHDNLQRYFPGEFDEVYLYSRVLSQDEIAWLAGRTGPLDK